MVCFWEDQSLAVPGRSVLGQLLLCQLVELVTTVVEAGVWTCEEDV